MGPVDPNPLLPFSFSNIYLALDQASLNNEYFKSSLYLKFEIWRFIVKYNCLFPKQRIYRRRYIELLYPSPSTLPPFNYSKTSTYMSRYIELLYPSPSTPPLQLF